MHYIQVIAERKEKLNDPSTNVQQKFNIEWDIRQLTEDVERWKETIRSIDEQLEEMNETAPSTVVRFKI